MAIFFQDSLNEKVKADFISTRAEIQRKLKFFLLNWWRIVASKDPATVILELLLKMFSPGPWLYLKSMIKGWWVNETKVSLPRAIALSEFRDFVLYHKIEAASAASIDWRERGAIKKDSDRLAKMFKLLNKRYLSLYKLPLKQPFVLIPSVYPSLTDMINQIERDSYGT